MLIVVLLAMLIVMVMVMMSLKTQLLLLLTPLIIGCAEKEPKVSIIGGKVYNSSGCINYVKVK